MSYSGGVQAVILIGVQGSGKSTFYERRFASTHVRISRDIAATPAREKRLLERCVERRLDFVVDNTNATAAARKYFIESARSAGYRVTGYFFNTDIKLCLARNAQRTGKAKVPVPGIYRTRKVLERPRYDEGFDALHEVENSGDDFCCREIVREEFSGSGPS